MHRQHRKRTSSSDCDYLYVLEHPHGFYKLGKAADPINRLHSIQSGSPYDLECKLVVKYHDEALLEGTNLERVAHDEFEECCRRGEWFDADYDEIFQFLARAVKDDDRPGFRLVHIGRERDRKERYERTPGVQYKGVL